jgi:hypothetical protein
MHNFKYTWSPKSYIGLDHLIEHYFNDELKNLGQSKFYFRLVAIFEDKGKVRYKYFYNNVKIDRSYKDIIKGEFYYNLDKYSTLKNTLPRSIIFTVFPIDENK